MGSCVESPYPGSKWSGKLLDQAEFIRTLGEKGISSKVFLKVLEGSASGQNFPSPWATMLALRLYGSNAALTHPQKVLSICNLVCLKMLDFCDRKVIYISFLTYSKDLNLRFLASKERIPPPEPQGIPQG